MVNESHLRLEKRKQAPRDLKTNNLGKYALDLSPLEKMLVAGQHSAFRETLSTYCERRLTSDFHGSLNGWIEALNHLPVSENPIAVVDGLLKFSSNLALSEAHKQALQKFHPWRKGPFQIGDTFIDTEWRSDWKWNRLAGRIDFQDKLVCDVGCGNGYFGWRMVAEGAKGVLGIDPTLLFVLQSEVFRRVTDSKQCNLVLPVTDDELPDDLRLFDVAVSMGVLYHRTSPIDHLLKMRSLLVPKGEFVLETLILADDAETDVLVPEGRYAKMRNVWFLPKLGLLCRWLHRTGFKEIEVIDATPTTIQEQRRTEWMQFESLADFLDPEDHTRTIEGHPAPLRAMLKAKLK